MYHRLCQSNKRSARHKKAPHRTFVTFLLCVCVILIYSDSNLLAPNLSACARDLGLNDLERDQKLGGGLAFGLFVVGAPAALLIGVAADGLIPKTSLMGTILAIGGIGCILSGVSQSYGVLFVSRALTGVSVAGGMPLTYALTTELYSSEERTRVSSRLNVCSSMGVIVGQSLSGWIGPTWGWRAPFLLVGGAILLGSVIVFTQIPPSSITERDVSKQNPVSWRQWSSLVSQKTYLLLLLQGILGCVPWSVFATFVPDYLHSNVGYSVEQATTIVLVFKIGVVIGVLLTGEAGQRLYNLSSEYPPMLMFVTGSLRVYPIICLFYRTPTDFWNCCALAIFAGILSAPTGALVQGTLSNVVEKRQQGVAYASFVLTDDIGRGGGPVLVAFLIEHYGRQRAFGYAMLMWVPNSFLCGLTALTVEEDERRVRRNQARQDMVELVLQPTQVDPAHM